MIVQIEERRGAKYHAFDLAEIGELQGRYREHRALSAALDELSKEPSIKQILLDRGSQPALRLTRLNPGELQAALTEPPDGWERAAPPYEALWMRFASVQIIRGVMMAVWADSWWELFVFGARVAFGRAENVHAAVRQAEEAARKKGVKL